MKQCKALGRRVKNKRFYRSQRQKLKRKKANCLDYSWSVLERIDAKIRLLNSPYKKTRRFARYRHRVFRSNSRVKFFVPKIIDIYSKKNFESNVLFIDRVRECCLTHNRKVFLDFSKVEKVSAGAMLSFLAEIDVITKKSSFGVHAVAFNHPEDQKVESILKQVGFYDLLKKSKRETKEYEDVNFWQYTSGACSEPVIAQSMMDNIKAEVQSKASKKLYRGFVEAMSNSVEHAYLNDKEHSEEDDTAKWWTFAGVKDSELVVVICDKGVGIPKTLPHTQGVGWLQRLFKELSISAHKVKDSTYIKAASSLSRTRTGKTNRGKGLKDMKSVTDELKIGYLSIYSNRGFYTYRGTGGAIKEFIYDHKRSINGTVVEWNIPLGGIDDKN